MPVRIRRALALVVAVVLAALIGGCTNDNGGAIETPATTSTTG
jgi:hypothetical protein